MEGRLCKQQVAFSWLYRRMFRTTREKAFKSRAGAGTEMQSIAFIKQLHLATWSATRKHGFNAATKAYLPFTSRVRRVVAK